MEQNKTFVPLDPLPSFFVNALGRFLSTYAENFEIIRLNATTIRAIAGANTAAATIGIQGRWRYIEANVDRAHPGGAAGTYKIFVTAHDNSFAGSVDSTNYAFDLAITSGANPAGVDLFRQVGTLIWDGTAITAINQDVDGVREHAASHLAAGTDPLDPTIFNALCPVGTQLGGSWSILPTGWAWADGGTVSIATYPLFDAMAGQAAAGSHQHKYNAGVSPGAGLVRKPDKRGRVLVGADDMGSGAASRLGTNPRVWGQSGGEQAHVLLLAELAAHSHAYGLTVPGVANVVNAVDALANIVSTSGPAFVGIAGSDAPHNNLQPYQIDGVIVKLS